MTNSDARTMRLSDIPLAMELSTAAKWNQTPEDWGRVMELSPEGCRVLQRDGRIVATTTLLAYGTRLAWIGMVLTHAEYRRQGLARQLLEDAILTAQRNGIRTLMLDATDEGRPLYESLGFVAEQSVERWGRGADGNGVGEECLHAANLSSDLFSLDATAFGVDRGALLRRLFAGGEATVAANGYVCSRAGREARYLGPCVASERAEACRLIVGHLDAHARLKGKDKNDKKENWYWDLLAANTEAAGCAASLGFTRRRILWRMRRGEEFKKNDAMVYAIAGFELG